MSAEPTANPIIEAQTAIPGQAAPGSGREFQQFYPPLQVALGSVSLECSEGRVGPSGIIARLRVRGEGVDLFRDLRMEAAGTRLPFVREVLDLTPHSPGDIEEALSILTDAVRDALREVSGAGADDEHNRSDLGNARRLVARHGEDIRYCFERGSWLIWNGWAWSWDENGEIDRLAKDTVEAIPEEVAAATNGDGSALLAWATTSESAPRLRAMRELARTEPGIPIPLSRLDADPMLLGVENGVVDLRSGVLLPPRREDYISKTATVRYDPEAVCPRWDRFMEEITGGDADLIRYLHQIYGMSLTGDTREQQMFILHGPGKNGKSTLIETVKGILGPYAVTASASTFQASNTDRVRSDIAALAGARHVAASEGYGDRPLDGEVIKRLTGGDTVTARRLFQAEFEFTPQFQVFLATNHLPDINRRDAALGRRIRIVPLTVECPEERRDKRLKQALLRERSGVLARLVGGCLDWQKNGLVEPEVVRMATANYHGAESIVACFVEGECERSPTASVFSRDLHKAYVERCERADLVPLSKQQFSAEVKRLGFERKLQGKDRLAAFVGLRLLQNPGGEE
jgi:putative DNA primase/helicase